MLRKASRRHSAAGGQALAETGITVVILSFLVMGIVEGGFTVGGTSMIVHALRDGARYGATLGQRNAADGCLTMAGKTNIQNHVQGVLNSVGFTPAGGLSGITVTQGCDVSTPTLTVGVTG